jgi:Uma2 family endonuclease
MMGADGLTLEGSPMTPQTASYLDAIAHLPAGGTLILGDVSWVEYEQLLADLGEGYAVRVSYDQGRLEIMAPSAKREKYKELILRIADTAADELGCELDSFGSTTFKLSKLAKGSEPDTCFYVQHAGSVTGKDRIDLSIDPPPDVVVEIDVAHDSRSKLAIYASLRVPELWVYDERRLRVYHLTEQGYVEAAASLAFPPLNGDVLSRFLEQSKTKPQRAVLRSFREWLRVQR